MDKADEEQKDSEQKTRITLDPETETLLKEMYSSQFPNIVEITLGQNES